MEDACEQLLEGGDVEVFLALIADCIQAHKDDIENISGVLLMEKYQPILVRLGWELLELLVPQLHPSDTHSWHLVHQITVLSPPKEMVLALLEQMECVAEKKPLVVFMMLRPLRAVLGRLDSAGESTIDSYLKSTFHLLKPHLSSVMVEVEDGRKTWRRREREEGIDKHVQGSQEEENDLMDEEVEGEEEGSDGGMSSKSELDDEEENCVSPSCQVSVSNAVELMLEFVQPYVEEVHSSYVASNGGGWLWTNRQSHCIAMLLSLLVFPLVYKRLASGQQDQPSGDTRRLADDIMSSLHLCHCSCLAVPTWTKQAPMSQKQQKLEDADGRILAEHSLLPPPVRGMGCYAYLLIAENLGSDYLPVVYSHIFFFSSALKLCKALLEGNDNCLTKKGLKLLMVLLTRLPSHTLPLYLLDDQTYLKVAEILVNLMTLSDLKYIRHESVKQFEDLVRKFEARGRHRFYRCLLHTVNHSGFRGLIIHAIKEEVAEALNSNLGSEEETVFLGPNLVPILEVVVKVEAGMELMKEMDRVMATLNLLRYLLIRDKKETNRSGVWQLLDNIHKQFLQPLRSLLSQTQVHCRNERKLKQKELGDTKHGGGKDGDKGRRRCSDEPQVTVDVLGGGTLSDPTLHDQIEMLEVSQHHLDMMESVIIRVEELMIAYSK